MVALSIARLSANSIRDGSESAPKEKSSRNQLAPEEITNRQSQFFMGDKGEDVERNLSGPPADGLARTGKLERAI
jgi:hypothetical protein